MGFMTHAAMGEVELLICTACMRQIKVECCVMQATRPHRMLEVYIYSLQVAIVL